MKRPANTSAQVRHAPRTATERDFLDALAAIITERLLAEHRQRAQTTCERKVAA